MPLNCQLEPTTLASKTTEATAPHAKSVEELLVLFAADPDRGFREEQVAALRAQHGLNQLTEAPPAPT